MIERPRRVRVRRPKAATAALANGTRQQYIERLRTGPEEVPAVRRTASGLLQLWGRADMSETVVLCLSELITNVIVHTDCPHCVLRIENSGDHVRISVSDTSTTLPVLNEADPQDTYGRGLFLISQFADDWGTRRTQDGKEVWISFATRHNAPRPG